MEGIMKGALSKFVEEKNIIHECQHGFSEGEWGSDWNGGGWKKFLNESHGSSRNLW